MGIKIKVRAQVQCDVNGCGALTETTVQIETLPSTGDGHGVDVHRGLPDGWSWVYGRTTTLACPKCFKKIEKVRVEHERKSAQQKLTSRGSDRLPPSPRRGRALRTAGAACPTVRSGCRSVARWRRSWAVDHLSRLQVDHPSVPADGVSVAAPPASVSLRLLQRVATGQVDHVAGPVTRCLHDVVPPHDRPNQPTTTVSACSLCDELTSSPTRR